MARQARLVEVELPADSAGFPGCLICRSWRRRCAACEKEMRRRQAE